MDKKCSVKKFMGIWICLVMGLNFVKLEVFLCSRLVVYVNFLIGILVLVV